MAVTCFYAVLDPESGSLRYANAGHDLLYLWRGGDAEELRARGMPLGLMAGIGYEEQEASLSEGERALLQRRAGRGPRLPARDVRLP
jgi:serine phosphatase RsbU (regulator of sigma subunit)